MSSYDGTFKEDPLPQKETLVANPIRLQKYSLTSAIAGWYLDITLCLHQEKLIAALIYVNSRVIDLK